MDGRGTPLSGAKPGTTMAPPLGGSRTATGSPDAILSVVLKGLSGPVNGVTYDAQMVPMQNGDDDWIASVTSYVRTSYGNKASFITTNDVARVRAQLKDHTNAWTTEELVSSLPQPLANRAQWKLSASHNAAWLPRAVDGNPQTRYDTRTPQVPGMWLQVELPEITEVSGIILDANPSITDFPQAYKVELSADGQDWGQPVATGHGTSALTEIIFPTAPAKFIRITQTGSHSAYFWSIHEMQILQPAQPHKVMVAAVKSDKTDSVVADPLNISPLSPAPAKENPVNPAPAPTPQPATSPAPAPASIPSATPPPPPPLPPNAAVSPGPSATATVPPPASNNGVK